MFVFWFQIKVIWFHIVCVNANSSVDISFLNIKNISY